MLVPLPVGMNSFELQVTIITKASYAEIQSWLHNVQSPYENCPFLFLDIILTEKNV